MAALYNEIDPGAVAWLRELIAEGLIAPGDVADCSIEDLTADDVRGYAQFHAFAGIGGWSLALRKAGWPDDRPVWTGSCPCQPFSAAGKGAGLSDERHLWPAFYYLISQRRPAVVFGEQVASKQGIAWLDVVFDDMEAQGYACGAAIIPAAGAGAPHIRDRQWWVADAQRDEQSRQEPCHGAAGRMGRVEQPVPWDRDWQSALREFRALDDGLSYGVVQVDAPRNAIVPQVASAFIAAYEEAQRLRLMSDFTPGVGQQGVFG